MGQHDRPLNLAQQRIRFEIAARHVHRLGPRPLAEVFIDLAAHTGSAPLILSRLAAFERLTPAMLAATGGGRFPPRPLCLVPRS